MLHFNTTILQFNEKGEKTGWTYITVPAAIAQQLKPGNKKTFRVRGKLDDHAIKGIALLPMGEGDFIMPLNAAIRKGIKKRLGAPLSVQLQVDNAEIKPPAELMECLLDEPKALLYYNKLPKSHQNYFTNWINEAKTEQTKIRRIAQAVTALAKGHHYGQMVRTLKEERNERLER